jgi:hypothetical protein
MSETTDMPDTGDMPGIERDPAELLADVLGPDTAAAMVAAGATWVLHNDPTCTEQQSRTAAAGVLYASLRGLDGSELLATGVALGNLTGGELLGIADTYALFLGAEYAKRLDRARDAGRVEGVMAGLYPEGSWLIWSVRHSAWWKWAGLGYTSELVEAGRFTPQTAQAKCKWDYDHDRPGSVMVPGPSLHALAAPEVGELMRLRVGAALEAAVKVGPPTDQPSGTVTVAGRILTDPGQTS